MNTYNISQLLDTEKFCTLFDTDKNNRKIDVYKLSDAVFLDKKVFYPSTLIYSHGRVYTPVKEQIMSLKNIQTDSFVEFSVSDNPKVVSGNLFYFIYNTDNYYHFLYDSMPYLISFLKLRETMDIKLLMSYPNSQQNKFYKFVTELLEMVGIDYNNDVELVESNAVYSNLYVSDSYTHGHDSNIPPRNEIFDLYNRLTNRVSVSSQPKKLYISRRSWKHNDFNNIGTNYTTRRELVNESELVEYLESIGYTEIFTELLTTSEKISLFKNATHIIGAIGGGLANVLFSNTSCKLVSICSPEFLNVNERFLYSFKNVKSYLYTESEHVETTEYKKYMRVQYKNIVGEVTNIQDDLLTISYLNESLAGWNNALEYHTIVVPANECTKLDNGLNSMWKIDLDEFKLFLKETENEL